MFVMKDIWTYKNSIWISMFWIFTLFIDIFWKSTWYRYLNMDICKYHRVACSQITAFALTNLLMLMAGGQRRGSWFYAWCARKKSVEWPYAQEYSRGDRMRWWLSSLSCLAYCIWRSHQPQRSLSSVCAEIVQKTTKTLVSSFAKWKIPLRFFREFLEALCR